MKSSLKIQSNFISSILLSLFLILSVNAEGAYSPLSNDKIQDLINSDTRIIKNLDGGWEFSTDELKWTQLNAPYSHPTSDILIYKKNIKIKKDVLNNHSWQLKFLGIDDAVEVYINNQFISRHMSALNPFSINIPQKMLSQESNELILKIYPTENYSNKIKKYGIYKKKAYSGLIREILFVGTPKIWIEKLDVKSILDNSFKNVIINSEIKISSIDFTKKGNELINDSTTLSVFETRLITLTAKIVNKETQELVGEEISHRIKINPDRKVSSKMKFSLNDIKLWNPDEPNLYEIIVELKFNNKILDRLKQDIGFKSVEIKEIEESKEIILNGKIFKLKSVEYIEDYINSKQTLSAKTMEADVISMKKAGINSVKFKFNSPHPYFINLCNKYGLLVLIDLPIYDVPSDMINSDEIFVRMKNISELIIDAYDNSPSVFAYGIMHGLDQNNQYVEKFSNNLTKIIKHKSSKLLYQNVKINSRNLITNNFNFFIFNIDRNNLLFSDIRNKIYRLTGLTDGLPIVLNYGVPIQPSNHEGYSDRLSVDFQAYFIKNMHKISVEYNLSGNIINSFNDYLLENPFMITNNEDFYLSTTGLTSRKRENRLSYTTLQSIFTNEKSPLLSAGNYNEKAPISFIIIGAFISIVLLLLINRFRRFREYLIRSVTRPYNFYSDIRDQRIMSSFQTFILGFVISVTLGIFLSNLLFFFRNDIMAQYILNLILPSKSLQEIVFRLTWMPEVFMLTLSSLFFVLIYIIAFFLRILGLFLKSRVYYGDTITITIWAGVPFIFILPIAIVINKILFLEPALIWVAGLLFFLFAAWTILRLFKATAVVFDKFTWQIYSIGFIALLVLILTPLSYYQFSFSVFYYIDYAARVLFY